MQPIDIILIVIIIVLVIVLFYLFQNARKAQESLGKISADYEVKIRNLEIKHQQEIDKARRQSVEQSRHTIKGQVAEQLAPLLPGFPYLPSDCRFIGDPIDYLVVKGYTAHKDHRNTANEPIEIVVVDIKHGQASLSEGQRKIAKAIETGRVRFEVIRISDDGKISVQPKSVMLPLPSQSNDVIDPKADDDGNNDDDEKIDSQRETMIAILEEYPNAYKPWTAQDDVMLREKFLSGVKVKELASVFERQPSAIKARLKKLGLKP
jgi:predicted Holliday junction resolvase-like endonuclease